MKNCRGLYSMNEAAIGAFLMQNYLWLITVCFGGGGFYYLVKNLMARFDEHETKFDARVLEHERAISNLQARLAGIEAVTQGLQRMETRLDDVWKHIMRQGHTKL